MSLSPEQSSLLPNTSPTSALYIWNLSRPLALPEFEAHLTRAAGATPTTIWFDRIRSYCLVKFASIEQAYAVREQLNHTPFPPPSDFNISNCNHSRSNSSNSRSSSGQRSSSSGSSKHYRNQTDNSSDNGNYSRSMRDTNLIKVDYVPEKNVAEWIAVAEKEDEPRATVRRRIMYIDGVYKLVEVGKKKRNRESEHRRLYEADLRQRLRVSVIQRRADNAAAAIAETEMSLNSPVIKYTHTKPEIAYSEAPRRLILQRLEKSKRP